MPQVVAERENIATATAPTTVPPPPVAALAPSTPIALNPGVSDLKMWVRGVERSYTAVVPPTVPATQRRSLLIVLHGVGGRGASMRNFGFDALAAPAGAVTVYPDGVGGYWNDGRPGMDPTPAPTFADEVLFITAMIDEMVARAGVDPKRVAIAGFSNGAIMASRAACELSERIQALAAVGGTAGADFAQVCQPKQPVSVLVVAGTNDPIVPFNGGQVADFQGRKRGRVTPVTDYVSFWASKCGCGGVKEMTAIKAALPVTPIEGQSCGAKAAVLFYRVQGGSHEWYRFAGFDTTKVVWDFVAARA